MARVLGVGRQEVGLGRAEHLASDVTTAPHKILCLSASIVDNTEDMDSAVRLRG